jgi:hypothetical protein
MNFLCARGVCIANNGCHWLSGRVLGRLWLRRQGKGRRMEEAVVTRRLQGGCRRQACWLPQTVPSAWTATVMACCCVGCHVATASTTPASWAGCLGTTIAAPCVAGHPTRPSHAAYTYTQNSCCCCCCCHNRCCNRYQHTEWFALGERYPQQSNTRRLHLQASVKDSEFIYDKDYNAKFF